MNKNLENASDEKGVTLEEDFPRYLLNPFEVISRDDSRYDNAFTHAEVMAMTNEPAQQ